MPYKKTCQHCGNEFEAKKINAISCSQKCNFALYTKRLKETKSQNKELAGTQLNIETPTALQPLQTTKIETIRPPAGLEPTAQWIIDQQKERIDELKGDLKEKITEIKTLEKSNSELKESLKDVQGQLNEKPGALQGFIESNPSIIEQAGNLLGPLAEKLIDKLTNQKPPLEGPAALISDWIFRQLPEVQQSIVMMLDSIARQANPVEKIAEITRSMVNKNTSTQSSQSMGAGFGR